VELFVAQLDIVCYFKRWAGRSVKRREDSRLAAFYRVLNESRCSPMPRHSPAVANGSRPVGIRPKS
jgi:hypothetical protein